MWNVPVMRSKLPTADRVMEYLRRIDKSHFYSDFGPRTALIFASMRF
jgi:hypothetical protein